MPDVPLYLDPLLRAPKQQTIKQNAQEINPNPSINLILKKTQDFRKASCWRHSKDRTNLFFKT